MKPPPAPRLPTHIACALSAGLLCCLASAALAQGSTAQSALPAHGSAHAPSQAPEHAVPVPWQCDQALGTAPRNATACTAALAKLALPDEFKSCTSWLDSASPNDPEAQDPDQFYPMTRALAHLRDASQRMRWHRVAAQAFMLQLPCKQGAYNTSSWFIAFDGRGKSADAWPMAFSYAVGEPKADFEVFSRWVGRTPDGLTVIGLTKLRGMGDAGLFTRHRIDAHTLSPLLVQAMEKTAADGRNAFGFNPHQPLRAPQGAGWVQLAPPKPGTPAAQMPLQVGMAVREARGLVLRAGWRPQAAPKPAPEADWGTERTLRAAGLRETQACAMDSAVCLLHYRRGERCLSLAFEGEQVPDMRLQDWGRCTP